MASNQLTVIFAALKTTFLLSLITTVLLFPPATSAGDANKWTLDVPVFGLAVGMTGDLGIGPVNADLDVGFDKIWDNLEFAGMGTVRVSPSPSAAPTGPSVRGSNGTI